MMLFNFWFFLSNRITLKHIVTINKKNELFVKKLQHVKEADLDFFAEKLQ